MTTFEKALTANPEFSGVSGHIGGETGANAANGLGDAGGARWRPIETAPRDGTRIMVWSPRFGGKPVFAWWDTDKYAKRPIPRFITTDRTYGARDLFDVTHWQPLPTPLEAS